MKNKKLYITFAIIFYLELVYHIFIFNSFQLKDIFYISLFTLFVSIVIDILTSLFNHKTNRILFIIIILLLNIVFIAQRINFLFYGNVFSIYSLFNGGQVFEFFGQILSVVLNNFLSIILMFIPAGLLIIFNRKMVVLNTNYKSVAYKVLLMVLSYFLSVGSLFLAKDSIYSVKNLYFNRHVPNQTAKSLGLMTTMRLDLYRILSNFEESAVVVTPPVEEEKEEKPKIIEYNKLDIDFESLIASETNKTINNIHNYISSLDPTNKNEYTGYFKGKNLIYITAEAFSPIAVDPNLTPTLYKLVNTGFKFNNFYSPVYFVSTSDGEYINLTGLLPKESVWSLSRSSNNYLPYAYGKVFKNLGYATNAYHNGYYTYYDRHKSHPNMGYNFMACGNGLQKLMNCKPWPQSDLEMINATFDLYSDNENFMTYYMSISGHLEYNFGGNNMAYRNKALVADLPYSNAIKAYIACQSELDKALEALINKLTEKGILDDTVIALSTDHYPYGLKVSEMKEIMNIEDEKLDIHKNHLIIWNSQMVQPVEVNKYAGSLDILPTILNLFGIEFDSRLLMGTDIFSDNEGIIIFNDRSWITNYGKYNATKNIFTPFKDEIPENYIETINHQVNNKYVISKNILETNYYKYVLGE
ncbi:MAG: sulfatase-like hydrolase/transferase [Mollicutes bacterium]|nr:sulfatase-like hydrolase/transferase [Mollicutes bacterium]